MSAEELLRRAAKVLREHAEVAMPGKWLSLDAGDRLIAVKDDFGDFEYLVTEEPARDGETADYIALMHPPVALALANWLELEAKREAHYIAEFGYRVVPAQVSAVARAILREES